MADSDAATGHVFHLFTYGSLMPGMSNWELTRRFLSRCGAVHQASVGGSLYDTGKGWPVAVFDELDGRTIPGVKLMLEPNSLDEALRALDSFEGVSRGKFERRVIDCDGPCWAYHWPWNTDGLTRIVSWEKRLFGLTDSDARTRRVFDDR